MQLLAVGAVSVLAFLGGFALIHVWNVEFPWPENADCTGSVVPFDEGLTGRIRFEIDNQGLAAAGRLCVYDDDGVLRWAAPLSVEATSKSVTEIPVPREFLGSKIVLQGPVGSSSSGLATDVADCRGGVAVHGASFRFSDDGTGVSSGSGNDDCNLPWTSWYDAGQPEPNDAKPQTFGVSAPEIQSGSGDRQALWIGSSVAGAAGGLVWFARTKFAWMLFSRLRRSTLLDQRVRGLIHELVTIDPGVHARAVARTLELAQGQVRYHLAVLVRDGILTQVGGPGRRHFFVTGSMDRAEMESRALLRSAPASTVFEAVRERPGETPTVLADRLGWSLPRLSRMLGRLEEGGLIERRQQGRFVHVFPCPSSRLS